MKSGSKKKKADSGLAGAVASTEKIRTWVSFPGGVNADFNLFITYRLNTSLI
jgi:hypothetical protein